MSQPTRLEQILIVGMGPATDTLVQAFTAKGLNTRVVAESGDWSSLSKDTIKAVVVCKPATTQQAIAITQRLSRMGLGPIWTVLNVSDTTDVQTHGTYHVPVLVNEVADALSSPQPLNAQQSLARVYAPSALVGHTLDAGYLQSTQGVALLGLQRAGLGCQPVADGAAIEWGDCYVVAGSPQHIASLSHTPLRLVAGAASW